jgi:hypothetical protein
MNYTTDPMFSYSDERLKNNITALPSDVSEKLMQLQPKCFHLNREEKGAQHFGFIAQELEQVFPNLVKSGTNIYDGLAPYEPAYKMVNYLELIPVLLLKIQDLQRQLDELKGPSGDR